MAEKNVLVTGGAGFIGSHLTERLLEMGANVTVYDTFDKFYTGKEANLSNVASSPRFSLVDGDILDREKLHAATKGVDVIIHEAGQAGVGFSVESPLVTNAVNVQGTLNVLLSAKSCGVKRVVNASSSSIFGVPQYLPMDESHPASPTSPYGVSKLAAEQYGKAFHHVYGLDFVSLRYFSVYGPRGRPDQVIHRFTKNLVEGKPPLIKGDGSQSRDFTNVNDVVSATILAALTAGIGGEAFNIGFGARTSVKQLAEKLILLTGMEGKTNPQYEEESKGDFPHTQADNKKAASLLGWTPRIGLDEGLKNYVEWFMTNKKILKKAA
ncbi:MAG TPA: NAD-dependent epimerase/dehydratase family protein [Nitrososphaerales archaeon]|nr:NAD-dependent epimerase/dehydratase family protein [Nitrososphaerales archaeon]